MIVVLTGPTASGKSGLALSLAMHGPLANQIEIVSMDSAQVYRGMDLGTAKPSLQERAAVPHHLIDLIDPREAYSAARFRNDALQAVTAIRQRGRIPLVVGGSLLYGRALAGGLSELPQTEPAIREALAKEAASLGWPGMHAALARVDPQTAARLMPHDAQRISRALEVFRMSGKPLSAWLADQAGSRAMHEQEDLCWISLEPRDRGWLHQRIALRFKQMLEQGLLEEVSGLISQEGIHAGLPAMRAVGYRQCLQWLSGQADERNTLEEQGIAATRQFAKRQLTWLRAMSQRQVFACDDPDALIAAQQHLGEALEKSLSGRAVS
ncbi:MAG: tRNA (adenosine(37)-N6)-dimethylallyltransferase MiaA [Betaproteobacteria bacterium]|nr:tRNA (adenosine(37)-N6)-dimethylallyltransferase MiaA [Betaproteobacteria bacterium]NBO94950.1 tRNA (adenosine(37)-N6)-dimethylallyltransferase MiaA [Betaproteobacteria bacterium]NBP35662.1 tRNA (adenosine(37)-N6)-dimethylallyltransferase MiaA [Betaproteobacteria bacterium]NCW80735.1 tRNA (adenosine(37)-N6)-dimethylallyltransferase MiaA [Betaproteobacteria bacterium]NDA93363.1 tRNA (adenosine(37)-N6)-dimethylallyltransferase MiaA [Betaproteobacteria bacterium]